MNKRPSREADNHSATEEISRFLMKPKVHYRVHKNLSLYPIMG